jgi:lipopolysaccharide exporter
MSNKKKAISGAKWTSLSTAVNAILQFAQVAVIARILSPSSFGVVSVSTLVINFLSIFAHFGFSNSIIYKQESDQKSLSTIYYINIGMGILMFGVIYLITPLLIMYYHESKLEPVLHTAAFYFPIVFLGQIFNILLEKELRFKSLAVIDIVSSVSGTTAAILFSYNGFEALSLIYGLLIAQVIRMICQNLLGRRYFTPIKHFNFKDINDHLKFGLYNVADSILGFANTNVDTIMIGGLLGVKELGYYTIASQVAVYPVVRISPIIIQICYPIMARMKDSIEGLKNAYLQIMDFISFVNIPLLGGLFIMAPFVIPMIYGPGWEPTVPLIRLFVFMGIFSCLQYPSSPLAFSTGKPNLLFNINLVTFIIKLPMIFLLGKYYGLFGVALGFTVSTFIALVLDLMMVQRLVGTFFGRLMKEIAKPLAFCVAMIGGILAYRLIVPSTSHLNTIVQIAIGGLIFAALTLKFKITLKELMANLRPAPPVEAVAAE